jgi:signal transduction histidine kinase
MPQFLNSMVGRVFLVLIGGIVLSVLFTLFLAQRDRENMLTQVHNFHVVERVAQVVSLLDSVPPDARDRIVSAARGLGIIANPNWKAAPEGISNNRLTAALRERIGDDRGVAAYDVNLASCLAPRWRRHDRPPPPDDPDDVSGQEHPGGPAPPPNRRPRLRRHHERHCEAVYLKLEDGTPLRLTLSAENPRPFKAPPWLPRDYLLVFAACVAILAYVVARMSTRPLRKLAHAATALGHDIDRAPLATGGPTEVRRAAAAFNLMQARIRHHIRERTQMLAAITHDLQTPLTRLRLRLEKVEDEALRAKLVADLSAMHDMIREGLDLARSIDSAEAMQAVDLDSLLDSICADSTDTGQDVRVNGRCGTSIPAQPMALRRCLSNLVDNAVKYGGHARMSAQRAADKVVVRIRDDGPGIPADQIEAVFAPFHRLESSRSRETGGTGLGLTIARIIADKHGGSLHLRNHPEGGLEAILELPVHERAT